MSLRIALDNQPEFYTNLDSLAGRIILSLNRSEQVGSIVVKLEGEAVTALQVPHNYNADPRRAGPPPGPPGSIVSENHKILYKVQQVFPDDYHQSGSNPYGAHPLQPGEHSFPFKFKLPINNACSDPMAMSKIGGLGGVGGYGSGGGLFGMGGVRVMDGSKQLFLRHITKTLPPSLTGFPMEAEIRYFIKVTIVRPGFLKENWRFQVGFKFLPIEAPRPKVSGQEAFARRPFTFRPRSASIVEKKSSFFGKSKSEKTSEKTGLPTGNDANIANMSGSSAKAGDPAPAPSMEISARLPHPSILTCNKPIPLRVIAKKLVNHPDQVYLVSFEMHLIGITEVRAHNIFNRKMNRWVVVTNANLNIPLTTSPEDAVGTEVVIPDDLWNTKSLPNTVAPSFTTCNLSRRYELELKLGLAWGSPKTGGPKGSSMQPQVIHLPLHFAQVEIFSGITPPPQLLQAARNTRPGAATLEMAAPKLPPRTSLSGPSGAAAQQQAQAAAQSRPPPTAPRPPQDPLYPPQLQPGQEAPPYDDAPPSYNEAMADDISGPFDGLQDRPAYSGVTNENAPSQMPQGKN